MCKKYKILNLSTGNCYNGAISEFRYGLPDVLFYSREDAERSMFQLLRLSKMVRSGSELREEHLEIIEAE